MIDGAEVIVQETASRVKRCYVLIGPPACGKSTWTVEHLGFADCPPTHVVSSDQIFDEYAAANGITYREAFQRLSFKDAEREMKARFQAALDRGDDIIIDRTNMSRKGRAKLMDRVRERKANYRFIAVLFSYDRAILQDRLDRRAAETGKYVPTETVNDMIGRYEEPSRDEFDEMIIVV